MDDTQTQGDQPKAETADATPAAAERATTNDARPEDAKGAGTDLNPASTPALADNAPGEAGHTTDAEPGVIHDGPNEKVSYDGKKFDWEDKTGNAQAPSPDAGQEPTTPDLNVPVKTDDTDTGKA